jgi:PA14 domain-containing protein
LLIWVVFAMLGGILSVRHEAPQAYRTLATVPAIALLAGDVLARVARGALWIGRRKGEETPARPPVRVGVAGAILLLGWVAAASWEIGVYFGRQADSIAVQSSFNLTENYSARDVLKALEDKHEIYLSPRVYDFSPMRFLVWGAIKKKTGANALAQPPYHLIRPEIDFPVPDHGSDVLLLLSGDYWPVRDYFLKFYPNAKIELVRGPGGAPLYVRMLLSRRMLSELQGLRTRLTYPGGRVEQKVSGALDLDGSHGALASGEWTGGLRIEHGGRYDFSSDGKLETSVDGQLWKEPRFLPRGFHDLRVNLAVPNVGGPLRLVWKTPGGGEQPVPAGVLFRIGRPRLGLMATYFPNIQWAGEPIFRQITPILLLAWNDPDSLNAFSVRFTGALRIRTPGQHAFRIEADDGVRLKIDGHVLAESMVPNRPNAIQASADLTAADHPIQIDYFQSGGGSILEVFWRPPGEEETPIPPSSLLPGE